jgi:ParB/RepB/Spo0J family partition protein
MAINKEALAKKSAENAQRHHAATMRQADDAIDVGIVGHEATVDIALDQIITSRFQVKGDPDPAYLDSLAESIIECGLVSPVVVRKVSKLDTPDDESKVSKLDIYELVAGHTRVAAIRKLGWRTVSAVVKDLSDADAAKALTTDNAVRKALSDYEMWKHLEMLEAHRALKTVSGLAEVLGCNRQHIYRLRSYSALPADAEVLMKQNRDLVGATLAEGLAKDGCCETSPAIVVNALSLLCSGRIKSQLDVIPWIKSQITGPVSRSVAASREVKIERPGRCVVKIRISDKETRIQAEGIDQVKLQKLIEDHLDELY